MKSKNGNYKLLYQNIKKRRENHKEESPKSSSEINDDSLDLIEKSNSKILHVKTKNQ